MVKKEAYAAVVTPRVDTLTIALRDYTTLPKRWAICGVTGKVRGAPLPYWAFLRSEPAWVQVVRWTPASGSWSNVKSLADSVARGLTIKNGRR